MNRRDFLGQVAVALSLAGVACVIPAATFAAPPPPSPVNMVWVRLLHRIKGIAFFQGLLVIVTDGGVFTASAHGVGHATFEGDLLSVELQPYVRDTFSIQCLGPLPYHLRETPAKDLHVWTDNYSGRILWPKVEGAPRSWSA